MLFFGVFGYSRQPSQRNELPQCYATYSILTHCSGVAIPIFLKQPKKYIKWQNLFLHLRRIGESLNSCRPKGFPFTSFSGHKKRSERSHKFTRTSMTLGRFPLSACSGDNAKTLFIAPATVDSRKFSESQPERNRKQ